MRLSDYVISFLEEKGVEHVFTLSGGGCLYLVDSLGSSNIEYICNLHEQGAAICAEAYAQYTNKPSAVLVTTGPGGTNAITGVASAWLDSIPMIILSGQVPRKDMKGHRRVRQIGFQELDIVDMIKPITKYATTVMEPSDIKHVLQEAYYLATTGRQGPVWVDLPLDVQSADIDVDKLRSFIPPEQPDRTLELQKKITKVYDLINNSERPIILAGNGVRSSGALEKFLSLTKKLKIPVLTTWKAIDFMDENDSLFVGRPGIAGQRGANFSQQNSDLFISIGARLDLGQTAFNHKNFARCAKKVIIDVDEEEIKKMEFDIECDLDFDAGTVIDEMTLQIDKLNTTFSDWVATCKGWQKKYPVVLPDYWEQERGINNYVLIDVLSELMKPSDLLIPGSSGACSEVTMQTFRVKKGMRIFNSESLGSMGFGIPASIGGCIAANRRHTICIDGDGGFVLNIQELEVIKRLQLPIKYFILNNGGYISIRNSQDKHLDKQVASGEDTGVTLPNFEKISNSYDIEYVKLTGQSDIYERVQEILNADGPVICEVDMAPKYHKHITAPRTSTYKNKKGEFATAPMEDLWPFLPREEFRKNMIVGVLEEDE